MNGDVKKNPIHYIEHLEFRNKTKKMKEEEYYKKNSHIMRREENFHLFFNGANDTRIRNTKKSELETSKSPNRQQWGTSKHQPVQPQSKPVQRKRWGKPETPYILKDSQASIDPGCELNSKFSKEELERHEAARSTFQVAGNNLMRPNSKNNHHSIANRIELLPHDKKSHILKLLEQLESADLAIFN